MSDLPNDATIRLAKQLRDEGCSIQGIANQLGLERSVVRWCLESILMQSILVQDEEIQATDHDVFAEPNRGTPGGVK
jgi:predicted transcriptional regulator